LGDKLPFPTDDLPGWKIALLIGFPSAIALVIGGFVPHIYRSARRAATARRNEASRPSMPASRDPLPARGVAAEKIIA